MNTNPDNLKRSPMEQALSNPLILCKILDRPLFNTSFDLRLVSHLWNDALLSLPKPKFVLHAKPRWDDVTKVDPFLTTCIKMANPNLARSLIFDHLSSPQDLATFSSALINICDKFSDFVEELLINTDTAMTPLLRHVLSTSCPNLKDFSVGITSITPWVESPAPILPLPVKPNLTIFILRYHPNCKVTTEGHSLTKLVQLVINASPNISQFETVPPLYPDLSGVKKLKVLRIYTDLEILVTNSSPSNLINLTEMMNQVAESLQHFCIDMGNDEPVKVSSARLEDAKKLSDANLKIPVMPNLISLRNDFTELFSFGDALEDIGPDRMPKLEKLRIAKEFPERRSIDNVLASLKGSKNVFPTVKELTVSDNNDATLIPEVVPRSFPALKTLMITTPFDSSRMNLLEMIGNYAGLKLERLILRNCNAPKKLKELWECFSGNLDMFKNIQTLEIVHTAWNKQASVRMEDDLSDEDIILVKKVLEAMGGMKSVKIQCINFQAKHALELITFALEKKIPIEFL